MQVTATINVVPAGLSEQDRLIVTTAIKLLSIDGLNYKIYDNAIATAHLLILDEESNDSKAAMRRARAGQVKLIISSKPTMAKNSIGLQRPMELGNLKGLLKNLYEKLQSQLLNQQQRKQVDKPIVITELKATIFNILFETKTKKRILHLLTPGLPDIFVDGINRCLATTASEAQLDQLVRTPLDSITIDQLDPASFAVHSNDMNIQSLHNLLWLAGIKCSAGKILPGHSLDKPVKLRAWPNFTRNTFAAQHLKFAAILARQAMSLRQLAETTQLPLQEVVNFYNAAFVVDLIEFKDAAAAVQGLATRRDPEKPGLFAKIAKRLNIKNMF